MKFGLIPPALCLAAALFAASCSNKTESSASTPPDQPASGKKLKVGIVFDSGGRGDKSFNDSAWEGIVRAKKDFGIDESFVETKDAKDYETNLTALTEKGMDLVISVGIMTKTPLEKVAQANPNVKYAIIDAAPDEKLGLKNVRALLFKEEEGSFLAGYLAGLVSKTGKIGFVGGKAIALIKKFEVGYTAGAKAANPKVEMIGAIYTGNWDDQDTAKQSAKILFGRGADIVYSAAGRAGLGSIKAAKEEGKYAIGVDSDQDYLEPGTVLTSMMKRVDEAVYSTIKDLRDGKFSAGSSIYDLKVGGVGLSPMKYTKDKVGADRLAKVKAISDDIAAGKIKVPATEEELKTFLSKK